MKRIATAVVAAAGLLTLVAPPAPAEPARDEPQGPAKVGFPADFPALIDHEWKFALGGFGGERVQGPRRHTPVIFVHGNTVDAGDWYPVRDAFRDAGWRDQELWALSYNGLGANSGTALFTANPEAEAERAEMGWDGAARVTENDVNVPDLYAFIQAVRSYTGSDRFSIVGHSLGVTLARRTLKLHPELRGDLVAFVGIAGGNHGTSLCPPGSEGNVVSCDEIAAGTAWLADLNGPNGDDETYRPARWMTVYDGSGVADPAFLGPAYAQSPVLRGADNRSFAGTYHNDLRVDSATVEVYRTFIEQAEAARPPATPGGAPSAGGSGAPDDGVAPAGDPAPAPGAGAAWTAGGLGSGGDDTPEVVVEPVEDDPGADELAAPTRDPQQLTAIGGTTAERFGRHWSGAANAVAGALLLLGLALVTIDVRRRRTTATSVPEGAWVQP